MAIRALDDVSTPVVSETITEPVLDVTAVCDSCGMKASFQAEKDNLRLVFCGHHTRKNAASLKDRGFVITPENYSFE